MERQLLSDQWIAKDDNGPFLWQIPLPTPASKKPSKLGRLLMAIKQRVAAGFGSLRWGRRAKPDTAEVLQGDAGSSITTRVWSPVSGDATGSFLVRAMWKRWKDQLGLKRDGRRGEAHDTGWPRVMSLHHELQERRLVADVTVRIGNYEIREIPMSPTLSFWSLSEAFPSHQFPQLDAFDETLGCVDIEPGRSPMVFQLGTLSAIEGLYHAVIDQDLWFEVGIYSPAICYTDSISSLDLNDAGPSWVDEPGGSCMSDLPRA